MINTLYNIFYMRFGIRTANHLVSPPLPKLEMLDLPKQSILHYVNANPIDLGPMSDDFIFRNITKPIMVSHIVENGDEKGNPRKLGINPDSLIRTYHIKHRRFRIMKSLETASRDSNTLIVYNYGLIPKLYRYMRSFYSEYYKWWNIESAVWKNIAKVAETSDRHQFIICNMPLILPSVPNLQFGSTSSISQKTVKIFNTPESLMILELWKWFGPDRGTSVMSALPTSDLGRVNIIFQESGVWFCMNLGKMNSWRIATKEELEHNPEANKKGIDPKQLQRRFLRLLMSLMQVRATVPKETEVAAKIEEKTIVVKQDAIIPKVNKETGTVSAKTEVTELDLDEHSIIVSDETIEHDEVLDKKLDSELDELDTIVTKHLGDLDEEGVAIVDDVVINESPTLEDGVMAVCDHLADIGSLSAGEYKRFSELSKSYRSIVSPNGIDTLDKFIAIQPTALAVESSHQYQDIKTVLDKTMLKSSLHNFDSDYIGKILEKDIAGSVMGIQNAGIAVTDYSVEHIDTVMGSHDEYTVQVKPVEGMASILRFKLPTINKDGTFTSNGVKYFLRKQRGDLPIRKISPNSVSLTSYYGKTFINRSTKKVNDYGQWLRNSIMAKGLDNDNGVITNLHPTDVFNNLIAVPRLYSTIAMGFKEFTVTTDRLPGTAVKSKNKRVFTLSFDINKHEALYGSEAINKYEKDGSLIIGNSVGELNIYLIMDKEGALYIGKDGNIIDYCTIEDLLELDHSKAPIDFAELKVMGKAIPIGLVLGYKLGLSKLLKVLNVIPRKIPVGTRVSLSDDEYSIIFSDETLVFLKEDKKASLVLAGFNEYKRSLRQYSVHDFDRSGVYLNVLESNNISTRYLRELDLLYQMFIDPITRDILLEMKEPITFHGLLIRSCELLMSDQHPSEVDPSFMRIKGYERLSGAVYGEIVKTIRTHNGKSGKSTKQLDMNPYAVWMTVKTDPAVALVNDINPIENLKESEAVTFNGVGGRDARSMTKQTRIYHASDMGTISESTVDSTDVGTNIFTTADPQFTSLRGLSRRYKIGETGVTALLSTSALISPCSDVDDARRVNFVSIQQSHSVACKGYSQASVRTGYEQVIAQRTSDLFACAAEKPGKVKSISDTGIIIEYDDGEIKGYEIGRRFGKSGGLVIPHNVITNLKEGQKFKVGDMISYNEGFFEKDILNPNNVVWKAGVLVKTALMESTATLEDSSALSSKVAGLLTTKVTKEKNVIVSFDQSVHKLIKSGTNVTSEDILCIIEDSVTANTNIFDEESIDTLRALSAQVPQAKCTGTIERIEIFYRGDKEDMSDSLRTLVTASDKELSNRSKAIGKQVFTGSIDEDFRIEGDALALDTANIRFYITTEVPAGVGDKGVFANQMKTVFGNIYDKKIETESGVEVDCIFGYTSVQARIVNSPFLIGTGTSLLDTIGKNACKLYFDR